METIEYRTYDKSTWGEGPWQAEPDKKQWLDTATGYPCLIVRNHLGTLCGYVGVSEKHPCYQSKYDSPNIEVHGGLTFAGHCSPNADETKHICHKTDDEDNVWWLGFDCHHLCDLAPAMESMLSSMPRAYFEYRSEDIYRDFEYVTNEVQDLAKQLKALEHTPQAS